MADLTVTSREGETRTVAARPGLSVMEIVRENGFDELEALCGGNCSCATCHVYVAVEDLPKLPPMAADENDLLDCSSHRTDRSRLSCQIVFEEGLSGLSVAIAPAD